MAKVKVKKIKPIQFAYIPHTGAYDKVPYEETFNKVYGWIKETKGVRPAGMKCCLGVYYSDPRKDAPEACKCEIGWAYKGDAKPTGGIQYKELPETEVAEVKYVGTTDGYGAAYDEIGAWIKENGYIVAGPGREVYTKKPKMKDGKMIMYNLIQIPVKKK